MEGKHAWIWFDMDAIISDTANLELCRQLNQLHIAQGLLVFSVYLRLDKTFWLLEIEPWDAYYAESSF